MPVKTEKDLSENARSLWLKAVAAIETRNHPYAISLIQAVLKEAPEFLDGRKQLRKAEIIATKGKKSGLLGSISLKGSSLGKKDPMETIVQAEKSLEGDPYNASANHLLKEAALAANMPETAAFALETIAEGNPKDTKALHELGEHYYTHEQADKAVEVFNRIVEINPADLTAIKRGKDAAAKNTMKSGGWDTAKSYRDVMKNADEAVSLEQQSRMVLDKDMIDKQLGELHERAQKEPESLDVARKIAGLYEQKGDLQTAMEWYRWSNELAKGVDPLLQRKLSDLETKVIEGHIADREQFIAANPDHPDNAQYKSELDILKKQKAEGVLNEARKRVERNPTDLQFRYELGEQLLKAGFFSDAIPELQKARNNPSVRLKAMNLLGQCYMEKGMLDLAVKQFSDASREILIMDALRKEVLYRLGLVYEKMGKTKESLDCMKEIYDVDYGYEDVAQRVEKSYADAPKA